MKKFMYTNLADSVIYATFHGRHNNLDLYELPVKGQTEVLLREKYEKALDDLLEDVKKRDDIILTVTLNQLCDNRFLLLEKQDYHFKLLTELLESDKLKITTYGNSDLEKCKDLVSYTKEALEKCLQRLCGGKVKPDLTYVSSLFPECGIDNTDTPTRKGITLLLGYFPDGIQYNEKEKKFRLRNGTYCGLSDLADKSKGTRNREPKYGILTAFYSYHFKNIFNFNKWDFKCLIEQGKLSLQDVKKIIIWIENISKLNKTAHASNAFVHNAKSGIELDYIIYTLLLDKNCALLKEKINLWIGNIQQREEVEKGIFYVLKMLAQNSETSTRTAMYIDVKEYMNKFAEEHRDDDKLYKNFHTVGNHSDKGVDKRIYYAIINIIDYSYNLLNMLFAVKSCIIYEAEFSMMYDSGDNAGILVAKDFSVSKKIYEYNFKLGKYDKSEYMKHVNKISENPASACSIVKDFSVIKMFECETQNLIGTVTNSPYYNINFDLYNNKETGELFRYVNIEYPKNGKTGAAVLIVFESENKDNFYLLEYHFRLFTNNFHYEIVRGFSDPADIDIKATAIRELQEETGLIFDKELIPLGTVFPDTGLSNAEVNLYAIKIKFSGDIQMIRQMIKNHDETEDIHDYILVNSEELEKMIAENKLCDSFSLAAILKYKSINERNNSVV